MKILSLWEPWATLMAIGAKRIETRSWSTQYRGWLTIHAAKHWDTDQRDLASARMVRECVGEGYIYPLGCIVAVVKLEDCLPTESIGCLSAVFDDYPELNTEQELAFGNYDPGRWGWITDQCFRLPEPIPFKGKQGLSDLPDEIVFELRRQWVAQRCAALVNA